MVLNDERVEALDTALEIVRVCCSDKCYDALKSIKTQHEQETTANEANQAKE